MPVNNRIVRKVVACAALLDARQDILDRLDRLDRALEAREVQFIGYALATLESRAMRLLREALDEASDLREPGTAGKQGVPGSDGAR